MAGTPCDDSPNTGVYSTREYLNKFVKRDRKMNTINGSNEEIIQGSNFVRPVPNENELGDEVVHPV